MYDKESKQFFDLKYNYHKSYSQIRSKQSGVLDSETELLVSLLSYHFYRLKCMAKT